MWKRQCKNIMFWTFVDGWLVGRVGREMEEGCDTSWWMGRVFIYKYIFKMANSTYVTLEYVKISGTTFHYTVLILNGVLDRSSNHCVEFITIMIGPSTRRHLSHQHNQQEAEELDIYRRRKM